MTLILRNRVPGGKISVIRDPARCYLPPDVLFVPAEQPSHLPGNRLYKLPGDLPFVSPVSTNMQDVRKPAGELPFDCDAHASRRIFRNRGDVQSCFGGSAERRLILALPGLLWVAVS